MTYRKLTVVVVLIFLLVSVVPLSAQDDTTECEEGFRLFDNEFLIGDPLCIPENPERVVVVTPGPLLSMLRANVPIVGLAFTEILMTRFPEWEAEIGEITDIGFPTNLEVVLDLEPDLIIVPDSRDADLDALNAIAPTVAAEFPGSHTWRENAELFLDAVGEQESSEAIMSELDGRASELNTLLGDRVDQEISIIRVLPGRLGLYTQYSPGSMITEQAGFSRPDIQLLPVTPEEFNANPDDYSDFCCSFVREISLELLDQADGDIIILFDAVPNDDSRATLNDVLESPLWQTLEGVQQDQVYITDTNWAGSDIATLHSVLDDLAEALGVADEFSPNPFITKAPLSEMEMEATEEASASACEAGFRLIEHVAGETCIPEDPQRIAVAGDRHITETLVAMGIEPIAIANKFEIPEFVQVEFNDFEAVIDLGAHFEPNLEVLLEVQPDLIIMHGDIYDTLSQIAPTVQINNPFNGVEAVVMDVGSIFGEDQTELLLALLDDAVETVTCAVENPEAITVSMIEHWQGSIGLNTAIPWNTSAFLIEEVGFSIPEAHVAEEISELRGLSMERLDTLEDTEVLFVLRYYLEDESPETLLESPLWQSLEVVQNGSVLEGNFLWWSVGGPLATQRTADEMVAGLAELGLATPC
ncbi:MAG: ABC transporter substrate-binding protein [Chloroflexota bacterium]